MSKSKKTKFYSGADRDRTCDPRVANAMLSQLSYSPLFTKVKSLNLNGGFGKI